MWLRAEITFFRDQGPAKCLVLALCVLRLVSASVCLCSSVVGGWGIYLCYVSVFVGPWVCAPAFVCFVLSLIVFVPFPLNSMVPVSPSLCFFCSVQLCNISLCFLFASLFFLVAPDPSLLCPSSANRCRPKLSNPSGCLQNSWAPPS